MEFWDRVTGILAKKELKHEYFCTHIARLNYRTFAGWITKGRLPDVESAVKIANGIGYSLEYLLDGKEAAPEAQGNDSTGQGKAQDAAVV